MRPVSIESGFSYEDYENGMQTMHRAGPRRSRWIPEWAANDSALRLVIKVRLFSYARHGWGWTRCKDVSEHDQSELMGMADKYFLTLATRKLKPGSSPTQKLILNNHVEAVRRAGGYAALTAAIAYRSLRLGGTRLRWPNRWK